MPGNIRYLYSQKYPPNLGMVSMILLENLLQVCCISLLSLRLEIHLHYVKLNTPIESFEVVVKDWDSESNSHKSSKQHPRDLFGALEHSVFHQTDSDIRQSVRLSGVMSPLDISEIDNDISLSPQKSGQNTLDDTIGRCQRLQQAVPVSLSGITGGYGSYVNGIYLPTAEFQNDWPIYRRSDDHNVIHSEFKDMYLCFYIPIGSTELKEKSERKKKAWIIKNGLGIIFARCRLPDVSESSNIPPERIQFNDHGIRKDICWEMKSSVDVLGFRKRPGGIMRPASFFQLKSLPDLKEDILEITRPVSSGIVWPPGDMEEIYPPLVWYHSILSVTLDSYLTLNSHT